MASDVWSFGVLLGEIFSDGLRPYNDLSDRQVVDMLNEGARMKRPPNCPDEAYELMRTCFETSPADRPDFATIVTALSCALPDSLEPGSNEIMRAGGVAGYRMSNIQHRESSTSSSSSHVYYARHSGVEQMSDANVSVRTRTMASVASLQSN